MCLDSGFCVGAMARKFWACFLPLLLVVQVACVASAKRSLSDAATLLSIKQKLYSTAANNGTLEFWSSSNESGLCTWPGVSCQPNSTRVLSLSLRFRGLRGPLPELLGSLPELQELHLDDNFFRGQIPPSLFQATRLRTLSLGHNGLSGAVPGRVSNLQALVTLDLRNNWLSGTLQPLQGLNPATLKFLYLDGNNLTGDLSPFKSFMELRTLSARGNRLTGQLDALLELGALEKLYLGSNQLNGTLSALAKMTLLQRLDLGHNQLSGGLGLGGTVFAGLTSLQFLRLNSNNLSGDLPPLLGPGTPLRVVNLSGNHFTGSIPPQPCSVETAIIDLSENSFTGALPNVFANSGCANLVELWLGGNQLTGVLNIDSSVQGGLLLMALGLSRNNLTGGISATLGAMVPLMVTLDLSHNLLGGDLSENAFIHMHRLERFNLSQNLISGFVPTQLVQLAKERLRSLDLSYNSFLGLLPSFPLGGKSNHEYSFVGNLGLCSSDPATQLSACRSPPAQLLPPSPLETPSGQQSGRGKEKIVIVVVVVVVVIFFVLVMGLVFFVLFEVRRRKKIKNLHTEEPLEGADVSGTELGHVVLRENGVSKDCRMHEQELVKATDNFNDIHLVGQGQGGFSKVYKGKLSTGAVVAVKRLTRREIDVDMKQFSNEMGIQSKLSHMNLVRAWLQLCPSLYLGAL